MASGVPSLPLSVHDLDMDLQMLLGDGERSDFQRSITGPVRPTLNVEDYTNDARDQRHLKDNAVFTMVKFKLVDVFPVPNRHELNQVFDGTCVSGLTHDYFWSRYNIATKYCYGFSDYVHWKMDIPFMELVTMPFRIWSKGVSPHMMIKVYQVGKAYDTFFQEIKEKVTESTPSSVLKSANLELAQCSAKVLALIHNKKLYSASFQLVALARAEWAELAWELLPGLGVSVDETFYFNLIQVFPRTTQAMQAKMMPYHGNTVRYIAEFGIEMLSVGEFSGPRVKQEVANSISTKIYGLLNDMKVYGDVYSITVIGYLFSFLNKLFVKSLGRKDSIALQFIEEDRFGLNIDDVERYRAAVLHMLLRCENEWRAIFWKCFLDNEDMMDAYDKHYRSSVPRLTPMQVLALRQDEKFGSQKRPAEDATEGARATRARHSESGSGSGGGAYS